MNARKDTAQSLIEQISVYLSGGGLFSPELAQQDAVKDLLLKCRDELAARLEEHCEEENRALTPAESSQLKAQTGKDRERTHRFVVDVSPGGNIFMDDDDFHWDALLRVHGDFENDAQKQRYAEAIARVLNNHEDEIPYRP